MMDPGGKARVLVVDDSRYHRELAKDVLADRARVECCSDGREALEALDREPADLVISDLTMPGMSGLELLTRVQRDHPGADFVLITANATVESAVEALRMGATDYLQKPVRASDLILALERAVARGRILRENRRLRDELSLYESCRVLASCLEPQDLYATGLELMLRSTGRRAGFAVYRRTLPGSDGFHVRGFEEAAESRLRAALAGRKRIDLDAFEELAVLDRGLIHEGLREAELPVREVLTVPLRGADAEAGLLCLVDPEQGFAPAEIEVARVVGAHADVALKNAERYLQARERAFVDDVTELYNARYLLEAMDREIRRAERYDNALSILFLDLDRFKLVNDQHGHLVGSRALRQLSQLLAQCVRQVDTLARYGGDEFTILLVDTDEESGLQIAERIRRIVEQSPFEAGPDEVMNLTLSVGVATYPSHGRTREALLDAADKAMYRAKSNGRNRVCSASELA